jgi:DNA-directed RNA polymerase specialized sigma24 family protein
MQVRRRLRGPVQISAADDLPEEEASKRPSRTPDTRHASPSQIASAKERWFQLLKGQPDHYQRFIEMRFAGITYREIAERMGFDESTVRRAVRKIFREQSE